MCGCVYNYGVCLCVLCCVVLRACVRAGGGRKFLGHYKRHIGSQIIIIIIQTQSYDRKKTNFFFFFFFFFNKTSVLSHLCLSVCAIDVWSVLVSEQRRARFLGAYVGKTIAKQPFSDCNQTHFSCKFWLHSLDMNLADSFLYLWPKMASKMRPE